MDIKKIIASIKLVAVIIIVAVFIGLTYFITSLNSVASSMY